MSEPRPSIIDIPQSARSLTVFGESTTRAVFNLFHAPQASLFPPEDTPEFLELADALRKQKWEDNEVAKLVDKYSELLKQGRDLDVNAIARWVLAHRGEQKAEAVIECIEVEPPEEIDLIRVLSRKGSQKIVFLASWRLRQQEVVLKKILGTAESVERILSREMQLHPLSMVHPNIIETHFLSNKHGEKFLVERKLPTVLSDRWPADGLHDAANLLFDIASALKFLHDNVRVHGDVKPDNIGKRGEQFVLLDFGICRLRTEFSRDSTPTGSLRTRAPELLDGTSYIEPEKVDVWALGATVFNALKGRFPLIDAREMNSIPRVSDPEERSRWESRLNARARTEWEKWVEIESTSSALHAILADMLERDPLKRISASEVVKRAEAELPAFLRSTSSTLNPSGRFSPSDEYRQIAEYMGNEQTLRLIPASRKQRLATRLIELKSVSGFEEEDRSNIDALLRKLA